MLVTSKTPVVLLGCFRQYNSTLYILGQGKDLKHVLSFCLKEPFSKAHESLCVCLADLQCS